MNKALLNKILIFFLLLIWSVIGYKLITNIFGKNEIVQMKSVVNEPQINKENVETSIFALPIITRDPFLGSYTTRKMENSQTQNRHSKIDKKKPIVWPQINYYGFVKGENNKNALALLKIDGKLERVRKGTNMNGIAIKEIYQDSILVIFNNQKKIFKK